MPMLDAFIHEGALSDEAEHQLLSRLTDILLRSEGADPSHPVARPLAYVWLHRPAKMFAGGEPASEPRYRIIASVPAYDDERRQAMVAEVTEAVLDAEEGAYERDPMRVVCVPQRDTRGHLGRRRAHLHPGRHRWHGLGRRREGPQVRRASARRPPSGRGSGVRLDATTFTRSE